MITITDESVGVIGDHTWTAECQGEVYYCSMNSGEGAANVNCTPAGGTAPAREKSETAAAAPEKKRPQAPTGFAGFDFGMQAEAASERCVAAQGTWSTEPNAPITCSKAPMAVGLDEAATVSFCGGGLCSVSVSRTRAAAEFEQLAGAFVSLVKALRDKYGAATELRIPGRECRGRELECLRADNSSMFSRWTWPSGHEILLDMKPAADGATLAIKYSAPSSLTRRDMPGL